MIGLAMMFMVEYHFLLQAFQAALLTIVNAKYYFIQIIFTKTICIRLQLSAALKTSLYHVKLCNP